MSQLPLGLKLLQLLVQDIRATLGHSQNRLPKLFYQKNQKVLANWDNLVSLLVNIQVNPLDLNRVLKDNRVSQENVQVRDFTLFKAIVLNSSGVLVADLDTQSTSLAVAPALFGTKIF